MIFIDSKSAILFEQLKPRIKEYFLQITNMNNIYYVFYYIEERGMAWLLGFQISMVLLLLFAVKYTI